MDNIKRHKAINEAMQGFIDKDIQYYKDRLYWIIEEKPEKEEIKEFLEEMRYYLELQCENVTDFNIKFEKKGVIND